MAASLKKALGLAALGILLAGLPALGADYPWLKEIKPPQAGTLASRLPPPPGFFRVKLPATSFSAWLRGLPLRPAGWPVHLRGGRPRPGGSASRGVVALDVLQWQECADAVLRLRAEYLWSKGSAEKISFRFTRGDLFPWTRWRGGWRLNLKSGQWRKTARPDASRRSFKRYLRLLFAYGGTISLARDLRRIKVRDLKPGDVVIQAGSPGHAMLVVDMATNRRGERRYLLAQSYMPAQEFHVVANPAGGGPWYRIRAGKAINTPDWRFARPGFRRFVLGD